MHLPLPQEGWPRISQELPRYNPYIHIGQDLQCSTTQQHRTKNWENTLEEPKWLPEESIHDITNFEYLSNSRRCSRKKPRGNNIIRRLQGFWLHTQSEDGANTSRLRPPSKETVAAIMMLYKNTQVKVCLSDGDTEYFDIVTGVLQGDTLAPYLFIICLDYVGRTHKRCTLMDPHTWPCKSRATSTNIHSADMWG